MDHKEFLENFRQEWKNEIQSGSRREIPNLNQNPIQNSPQPTKESDETETELKAAAFFSHGVWLEDRGEVYEAIKFYRKAISIDPDIEFKCYRRNMFDKSTVSEDSENNIDVEENSFYEDEDLLPKFGILMADKSICNPMFNQSSTHISKLPNEMFHKILLWVVSDELDLQSLDLLSGVCRGFYLLCRNSNIWKVACLRTWGPKGFKSSSEEGYIASGYTSWREMFLLRPRLRLNGCYISRTTYFRKSEAGFQDESYEPYQCVSYYRYLRFFANGIVLMLTSADPPQSIVTLLKKKDCANSQVVFGRYMINGNFVAMNFRMPSKKRITKSRGRRITYGTTDVAETVFNIDMKIQLVKKRLHWQLTWQNYVIKSFLFTGKTNTTLIDTKDPSKFPPLLFSRVKSYCTESEAPLT